MSHNQQLRKTQLSPSSIRRWVKYLLSLCLDSQANIQPWDRLKARRDLVAEPLPQPLRKISKRNGKRKQSGRRKRRIRRVHLPRHHSSHLQLACWLLTLRRGVQKEPQLDLNNETYQQVSRKRNIFGQKVELTQKVSQQLKSTFPVDVIQRQLHHPKIHRQSFAHRRQEIWFPHLCVSDFFQAAQGVNF